MAAVPKRCRSAVPPNAAGASRIIMEYGWYGVWKSFVTLVFANAVGLPAALATIVATYIPNKVE